MTQQAPLSNFACGKADKPSGFFYQSGEFEKYHVLKRENLFIAFFFLIVRYIFNKQVVIVCVSFVIE